MSPEFLAPILLGFIACFLTFLSAWHWRGGKFLCENCKFNNPDDCRKIERPKAIMCLSYRKKVSE
jgi:hypothetical protein